MTYSENSFIVGWSQIFLPLDSKIQNFLDLDNKKIAILEGGNNGKSLMARCHQFEITCHTIIVTTYEDAFQKISNGEVDATVSNNSIGAWYLKKFDIIASSIIFNPTSGYVTIPKQADSFLLDVFDKNISYWKKDTHSFLYQSRSKWLNPEYKYSMPSKVVYSLLGLALMTVVAFFTAVILKRQVARRVKEISIRNQQFSQIINLVPHIIYVADEKGNIMLANKKASKYFGMTKEEIERCNIENFRKSYHTGIDFLNDNNLSQDISETELKEITTVDYMDNKYNLLLSKMPFKGLKGDKPAHLTVAVDITDIKEYQQKITHMAHYNALTKLPNKTLFKSKLEKSIRDFYSHGKYGAVLYIDLDSFKNINDSQGHMIGDLLIQELTKRLKQEVTEAKTIAHFGGDEFIIDLAELHSQDDIAEVLAVQFGETLLEMISEPVHVKDIVFQITASIGVVIYPRDGETEEILFQRADTALYKAKNMGRNNLQIFNTKLETQVKDNHQLETELRQALIRSEFSIVYQPIIKGSNHKIVGAEALVRWNHPVKGKIRPGSFIEVAEKIHLIVKIGYWVIDQACQRIKQQIDYGDPSFYIAVNVSVLQLKDKDFHNKVAHTIRKHKIPANRLEFELTESVLMEDVELSISIFNKLKILGIKISIDDFGTGYSSFNYLMKLPIDKLKIDQSFVNQLPMDKNSATIVRTIIKMASELGMVVVAEGIENQGQYDFLIDENCKYFQGFYFHRPIEFEEIVKLTSTTRKKLVK